MFKNRPKAGLTLIEVMVLVALVGLLATVIVPALTSMSGDQSQIIRVKTNGRNIYTVVLNDALNRSLVGFPSTQATTSDFFKDLRVSDRIARGRT